MILESTNSGHRPSYAAYFSGVLNDHDVVFIDDIGKAEALRRGIRARRLLLSTADDYLVFATGLSLLRMLILGQTILVTIRAEHALDRTGVKALVRRGLYRLLRDLPRVKSLSIMPHEVEPRLAALTNKSIYDPAFLELAEVDDGIRNPHGPTLEPGRLPGDVVFLGVLAEARNIRAFLNLFGSHAEITARALGRRAANLSEQVLANPGHVTVIEGHLDAADFLREFLTARSVWCAFRPEYDNFSGVFCNAVRLGTPVWVTKDSRLCKFARLHGGQVVCELADKTGQTFVLYREITLDIPGLGKKNEAALK